MFRKKFGFFTSLLLILSSCDGSTPSVLPSVTSTPTVKPSALQTPVVTPAIPAPSPTPDDSKYKGLEVFYDSSDKTYCNLLENTEKNIKYPIKVAVAKDGSKVYVSNGDCRRDNTFTRNDNLYRKYCLGKIPDEKLVNRKFIYKISKDDNNIDILKYNNEPVINCKMENEIATDEEENVYFSDVNYNIYRFSPDEQLTKIANVKLESHECALGPTTCLELGLYSVPIKFYVEKNNLYFLQYVWRSESAHTLVKKIDRSNNIYDIYAANTSFDIMWPFAIYNERLFSVIDEGLVEYKQPYPITDKDNWNLLENLVIINADSSNRAITEGYYRKYITDIKINSKGEIFLNDIYKHCIWKVYPDKFNEKDIYRVKMFAGDTKSGYKDGNGQEAEFSYPTGMDFDANDNLYVADTGNNAIRKITPDGIVTTFYAQNIINIGDKQ